MIRVIDWVISVQVECLIDALASWHAYVFDHPELTKPFHHFKHIDADFQNLLVSFSDIWRKSALELLCLSEKREETRERRHSIITSYHRVKRVDCVIPDRSTLQFTESQKLESFAPDWFDGRIRPLEEYFTTEYAYGAIRSYGELGWSFFLNYFF